MDETLIHCKDANDSKRFPAFNYDRVVQFKIPEQTQDLVTAYLKFRPYMHRMLKKLS
jgi:hypothetical protein